MLTRPTRRSGLAAGLVGHGLLLVALAATIGLGPGAWVVGAACAVVTTAVVARGLTAYAVARLEPADLVTLTRTALAGGIAALVTESFRLPPAPFPEHRLTTTLVVLAVVALLLDAVDGRVARRTRTASPFGARFDGEADAFLLLVLSVYVARDVGAWVLLIGALRYLFAAAGTVGPWLRRPLPPRPWRKVVTATQGIVLTVAAADVAPGWVTSAALVVALALLAESFGRDVGWLWRHRDDTPAPRPARAPRHARPAPRHATHRARPGTAATVTTVLAVVLVWFVLVAPSHPSGWTPTGLLRLPVEVVVLAALALVLPSRARRWTAVVVGILLALLGVVKVLDLGFLAAFDRPFNLLTDRGYLGPAVDLAHDTFGTVGAAASVGAALLLVLALLVGMPLAVGRIAACVAHRRRVSLGVVTALALVWTLGAATGVGAGKPVASAGASRLAVEHVRTAVSTARAQQRFEDAARTDPFRTAAEDDLLTALRGKDVLLAFVESYGRTALTGTASSARLREVLDTGTRRLRTSGYAARSAYLTSPTLGALSWLAHATLQSGLWVDDQLRHDVLLSSDRLTLSGAFRESGWRTVALMPSNETGWPEGRAFYRFEEIYDRRDIDYRGPEFGWSLVPDQYALRAFHRRVLAPRDRAPVMAEITLSSSHAPWAPLPRLVGWDELGRGRVFDRIHRRAASRDEVWRSRESVASAYVRSVGYSLRALLSYVATYGHEDLVVVLVGDHQPATVVSGHEASRDVPITILAPDPQVVEAVSGWGWQEGLRPGAQAPVWRMDEFRDRFLTAYSPGLASAVTSGDGVAGTPSRGPR